jgi:phospholipid/cholesterol/gamma-HCH transport system substrate-binding protein
MSTTVRLGVFIVTALAILAVGTFLIGDRQFLFSRTYELRTSFPTVAGLNNGAQVRVGGIPRGIVENIQLPIQPDQPVTVVMKLHNGTREVIRNDSTATIQTEGLLGDKYIDVAFGSPQGTPVTEGDTIAGVPAIDISDVVKKTTDLLDMTKMIASKIDQGTGTMGALVNDRKVYTELSEATAQAKQGAVAFQENMQALKRNFLLRGFFRNRGYDDSTRLMQNAVARLPSTPYVRKFSFDANGLFDKADSAKLKGEKLLNGAGQYLEQNAFGLAVVTVSGGMKGDSEEVLVQTQARAMVIRDYLVANFKMSDTLVKTLGTGKSDGAPPEGRVDIFIYPSLPGAVSERPSAPASRRKSS